VHTKLDHRDQYGEPLLDGEDTLQHRQAVHKANCRKVLILRNSHNGGHKYAGNMLIYTSSQAGVWYGRATTHNVEPIVHSTILGGKILPSLLRGGVNIRRPQGGTLLDW